MVARPKPTAGFVAWVGGLESWASSRTFVEERPVSSVKDFRWVSSRLPKECPENVSCRGTSTERRSLEANPMRVAGFLWPVMSFVGAVVMIAGAEQYS